MAWIKADSNVGMCVVEVDSNNSSGGIKEIFRSMVVLVFLDFLKKHSSQHYTTLSMVQPPNNDNKVGICLHRVFERVITDSFNIRQNAGVF